MNSTQILETHIQLIILDWNEQLLRYKMTSIQTNAFLLSDTFMTIKLVVDIEIFF